VEFKTAKTTKTEREISVTLLCILTVKTYQLTCNTMFLFLREMRSYKLCRLDGFPYTFLCDLIIVVDFMWW